MQHLLQHEDQMRGQTVHFRLARHLTRAFCRARSHRASERTILDGLNLARGRKSNGGGAYLARLVSRMEMDDSN